MTPEQCKRVKRIFLAVREKRPEDRAAFLDDVCGGNAKLRAEVESLLEYDEAETADVLEATVIVQEQGYVAGTEQLVATAQRQIGSRYRILGLAGAGGMGRVW